VLIVGDLIYVCVRQKGREVERERERERRWGSGRKREREREEISKRELNLCKQ
jgi:hypothetical protein